MKSREIIVFLNPDLLKSEAGFEKLKEFVFQNTPSDYSIIDFADGELTSKSALGSSEHLILLPDTSMIDYLTISGGYWKMTFNSLKKFLE